ncbi:alpha/beta hydrolase [Bacillus sp. HMF5848]|nr:alpha/beta hydrolase [Bacillus sp. HMF5848]
MGKGEPLVLIHGLGEVKEGWVNQYELSDQYDLIIPDLRGHGEYTSPGDITMKDFAADLISLLQELNIKRANICGLSMGGMVAQELYRQAPDMCHTLILVSTYHYAPKLLGKAFIQYRKSQTRKSKSFKERAARFCLYSWDKENIKNFHEFYKPNKHYYFKAMEACQQVNNVFLLPKINAPTLILGGQYDAVTPVINQYIMHKQIPHSEFIIFRKTGHVAKFEAKDKFNKVIREFLKKHN